MSTTGCDSQYAVRVRFNLITGYSFCRRDRIIKSLDAEQGDLYFGDAPGAAAAGIVGINIGPFCK